MSVALKDLPDFTESGMVGHRLINAKFPPIDLFNDVATLDDFEALYAIQSLTNPRLQNELGNLSLLDLNEIPFGISGCHYAAAPFTHINPDGSRFSDGSYGVLYIADTLETAIEEVKYHQQTYWQGVLGLEYERFVFKQLACTFDVTLGVDATSVSMSDPIYSPMQYTASRVLGQNVKASGFSTLKYQSVRHSQGACYALFTPKEITAITQARHIEMVWKEGSIKWNYLMGGCT